MKKQQVKSGQKRVRKTPLRWFRELMEKIGDHFSSMFVGRLKNVREVRLWVTEWLLLVAVVFLMSIVQMIWYGESYETEAYQKGGDYSEATLGKINSMNPLYATNNSEKVLAKLMFANLYSSDVSGHLKGELAKSLSMDDTGKVWTLELRDKIKWSDGEEITADDVVYTIGLITDKSAKTTVSADFSNVKIEKIDNKSVKFTLPSVYLDFMDTLEFPLVPSHILKDINPALVYESDFSMHPVVSGPFTLNAVQLGNSLEKTLQTVYLNRNEDYFLANTKLSSFTLKTFEQKNDIVAALRNLNVTATAELTDDINDFPKTVTSRLSRINSGAYAFLNTRDGALKEAKIRQAIRRAINIEDILGEELSALRLNYPILESQGEGLSFPELPETNLDEAKKLMEGAGYHEKEDGKLKNDNGETLKLNLAVQNRGNLKTVAENFTKALREFGIEVVLNAYDEEQSSADFFSAVVKPRDYDILFYEIDLGTSADPFVYYSSRQIGESGWNLSNYANSLASDALLSARTTTNRDLRKAKYESFLKRWVEDVPAIGLYQSTMRYYYDSTAHIYSEDAHMIDALDRFSDVNHWATSRGLVKITP